MIKFLLLFILSFSAFGFSADREIKTPNDLILDPGGESRSTKNFVMETSQVIRFNDSGSNFISLAGPTVLPSSYVLLLPDTSGVAEQILFTDGSGVLEWRDLFLASTDNKLLKSDTVGTAEIQESGITVDDSDNVTGVNNLSVTTLQNVAVGNYLTTDNTHTVTNKKLDGLIASTSNQWTPPEDTTANLTTLCPSLDAGSLLYSTDENKYYLCDGATLTEIGSGGGVPEDIIGARASMNHAQVLGTSTLDKMQFDTIENDTHGNFDPTTNYRYTVGSGQAGYYDINYDITIDAGAGVTWTNCQIIINGSGTEVQSTDRADPINTQWYPYSGHSTENLAVGDTVEIWCRSQTGPSTHSLTGSIGSTFSVYKKSSSGGASADLTSMKYKATLAPSYAPLPTVNTVNFDSQSFDDDGLVTTGAGWVFTADRNMTCNVSTNLLFSTSNVLTGGSRHFLEVHKNGVFQDRINVFEAFSPEVAAHALGGSVVLKLNSSDTFHIEYTHNDANNMALTTSVISAMCF